MHEREQVDGEPLGVDDTARIRKERRRVGNICSGRGTGRIQVNHRIVTKYRDDALKTAVTHITMGRTIVFPLTKAQKIKG